jgi:hypothetical protein
MLDATARRSIAVLLLATVFAGCSAGPARQLEPQPALVYAGVDPTPRRLTVIDGRGGSAWPPTPRDQVVDLAQTDNDLAEFTATLVESLRARGIHISYSTEGKPDILLHVKLLYSRCARRGLGGYGYEYNETSLQAELRADGTSTPIIGYFPSVELYFGKDAVRACYDVPRRVVANEVAAKINRAVFRGQVPTGTVENYGRAAVEAADRALSTRSPLSIDFQLALELGYTNNPAAREALRQLADKGNPVSRAAATWSLGLVGTDEDVPLLGRLYDTGGDPVRFLALKSMLEMKSLEAKEFVLGVRASRQYRDGRIRPILDLYDFPAPPAPLEPGSGK